MLNPRQHLIPSMPTQLHRLLRLEGQRCVGLSLQGQGKALHLVDREHHATLWSVADVHPWSSWTEVPWAWSSWAEVAFSNCGNGALEERACQEERSGTHDCCES